jgi:glutamate dehydrogenase (NAD(P)+)
MTLIKSLSFLKTHSHAKMAPDTEDEINQRLEKIVLDALEQIWHTSERRGVSLRTAAFAVACERILTAHEERGLYP